MSRPSNHLSIGSPNRKQKTWLAALGFLSACIPTSSIPAWSAETPASQPTGSNVSTPVPAGEPALRGYTKTQLETMLASPDAKQRLNALLLLRETGTAAMPVFIWALEDEDPNVRIAAIKSFGPLGAASETAAVPLTNLLEQEPNLSVQKQIIFTLGQMGPYAAEAVPVLQKLQREANLIVRVNAQQALDKILTGTPRP